MNKKETKNNIIRQISIDNGYKIKTINKLENKIKPKTKRCV